MAMLPVRSLTSIQFWSPSGRWSESVRRSLTGGPPEWVRLRQAGRDRGRPGPEWEIFHGLSRLALRRGRRDDIIEAIEAELDLAGSLGEARRCASTCARLDAVSSPSPVGSPAGSGPARLHRGQSTRRQARISSSMRFGES
jgi:hypothetical protein